MQDYKLFLENKDFDGAIKALKLDKSMEQPIKFFNLGYIYYQKNELPLSRYYFEKAQNLGFLTNQSQQALQKVKENLGVEQVESSYNIIDKTLLSSGAYREDVYLSLVGLLVIGALVAFLKSRKLLGSFFVLASISLFSVLFYFRDMKTFIVMKESYVHQGPSRIFEPSSQLSPGMKVIIEKEIKDWKLVSYPEEFKGWLYRPEVKKL